MNWNDITEQHYRREEWLQAAQQRRLVAMMSAAQSSRTRFYHPVLVGLGRRLVAWGWSLQARGGLIEAPAPRFIVDGPCN